MTLGALGSTVVLCVVVALLISRGESELPVVAPESPVVEEEENVLATTSSGLASLEALLARAEDLECAITKPGVDAVAATTTGTYFTSQGKMRGDFLVAGTPGDSVSSVILRDGFLYSWSLIAGESYGVKVNLADAAEMRSAGSALSTQEPIPLNEVVTYTCNTWAPVDSSIFEPPTDILFRDFSEVMNAGMEFSTSYDEPVSAEASCAVCAQVTAGQGRDECLRAFSCQE